MRTAVVFMVLVFVFPCVVVAGESLGVFFGLSHMYIGGNSNTYEVEADGICGGLLVPVHLVSFPLYLKVKALYHGAEYTAWNGDVYEGYVQVSNSVVFAVDVVANSNWSLQGGGGIGIQNESAYSQWGEGVSAAEVFAEVSAVITRSASWCRYGLMVAYEHGFNSEDVLLVTEDRAQVAAVSFF
jgi:hypothetical protein